MDYRTLLFSLLILVSTKGRCQEVIVDEAFAARPFRTLITQQNIRQILSGPITIVKKSVPNLNTNKADTMIVYKSDCCEVEFLRMPDKTLFYDATILSPELTLSKGVVVGMAKSEFIKIFNIPPDKSSGNVFVIDNTTGLCNHSFYFDADKLVSMLVDGCID